MRVFPRTRRNPLLLLAVFGLSASILTPSPANAVPNGTVACSVSGTFTVSSNVVTTNTSCTGRAQIPNGITEIANDAFLSATGLTSAFVPNTVTRIGTQAFQLSSLASIDFEAGSTLTTIASAAFQNIPLTSIVLPDSVTTLGNYQFWVDYSLTSVVLPANLTTLQVETFGQASALNSVTLPIGLTSIAASTFSGNTALTSYTYCGLSVSSAALNAGGLSGKTRNCTAAAIALSATSEVVAPNTPLTGYTISSPNNFGGGVVNYSISPNISNTPGLSFSASTGRITGTPTTAAAAQTYTISANNYASPSGSATFTITVGTPVAPPAPPIPDPKQLSKVTGISPESAAPGKATPVVISGTFIEKIVNVTINGTALAEGSWTQTATSVSLSIPKGSAGKYSISLYNGSAPMLSVPDFTYTAPPTLDWTSQKTPNSNGWNSIAFGNGTFVAVGPSTNGDGVMYSSDGKNWKAATGIINNPWRSVAYGNGTFVAVSPTGTGNRIMYSKDGANWSLADKTEDATWGWVKFGNGSFVISTSGATNRRTNLPTLIYSSDGISWKNSTVTLTSNYSLPGQSISSLGFGGGLFVLTGTPGRSALGWVPLLMTSRDGATWRWQRDYYGVPGEVRSQSYGCKNWIATRSQSGFFSSPVAERWSPGTSGSTKLFNAATFAGGLFVAVGSGVSALSNNATNWQDQIVTSQNNWASVTYGKGIFVAVANSGSDNRVMTAPYTPLSLTRSSETVALGSSIQGTASKFNSCTTPTYSISPSAEGTGLVFNAETGELSGKPLTAAASGEYTIFANDESEVSVSATYTLTVSSELPVLSGGTGSNSDSGSNSAPVAPIQGSNTQTPVVTLPKPETSTPVTEVPQPSETVTVTAPPVVKSGPLEATLTLNVYFDMGSSRVYGINLSKLQKLATTISGLGKQITISITGYAQPTPGSEATDGKLSEDRAAAVAKILRQFGVTTKVVYKGAGRAALNIPSSRYVEIVAANND